MNMRRILVALLLIDYMVPNTASAYVVLYCEELTPPPNCFACDVVTDDPGAIEFHWSKQPTYGHFGSGSITVMPSNSYHCPSTTWTGNVNVTAKAYKMVGGVLTFIDLDFDLVHCSS
jgi:hypothetical protein